MTTRCGEPTSRNQPCKNPAGFGRAADYGPCYLHVPEGYHDGTHLDSLEEYIPYAYRAQPGRVIDGDTIRVYIDLGFETYTDRTLRLLGVDTAELTGEHSALGAEQAEFVDEWLSDASENHFGEWPLVIDTERDRTGAYGRYLAYVWRKSDGAELTAALIDEYGEGVIRS